MLLFKLDANPSSSLIKSVIIPALIKQYTLLIISAAFLLFLSPTIIQAEETSTPRYYLHSIVDTAANPDYIPFIEHWIDNLYTADWQERKAYWSPEDTKRWGRPLFNNLFQQIPREQFLAHFPPFILSVHCNGGFCRIATSFMQPGFTPSDTSAQYNQNPFGIIEVGVYESNDVLYLTHLFDQRTAGYKRHTTGNLRYLIDPNLEINHDGIDETRAFADSLAGLFGTNPDTITFVVCRDPQELGYILGFNFFFAGYTTGMAQYESRTVFSGLGTFTYPHEIAHLVLEREFPTGSRFLSEGRATYFGGSGNKTFPELVNELKDSYPEIGQNEFETIVRHPGSPMTYTLGALVIEVIHSEKGIEGLKKLADSPPTPGEAMQFVAEMLEKDKEELFALINRNLKHN